MKMQFQLFWKLLQIFLLILSAEKADADYQNRSHAFNNPSKEKSQNITEINEGTKRKNETLSPFDYLSDALLENDLKQMCSIMSNAETQQIMSTMEGDYTILAPSDEAFGLIPGSKLDELKNNAQKRREFLLRHIIPGRLILKHFGPNDETEVKSVDNTQLHLTAYPNGYVINGANVVNGDIPITNTNNLIHIIDRVMYPKQELNLLELMEQNSHLSQMLSFLTLSGLQNELTANNSLTIFCPNDEAFRAIPWPVTQQMLSNNTFLRLLMANHIIAGKHYSTGLAGNQLYSIGGDLLNLTSRTVQSRKLILINSVPIVSPDLIATNGVIHIITRIMLPKPLLDDCKCIPKSNKTIVRDNETSTTFDPLLSGSESIDPLNYNDFDKRFGSIPINQFQNEDHFSSTPKPVSFKSIWDDIFGPTQDPSFPTSSPSTLKSNDSKIQTMTTLNNRSTDIKSGETRPTFDNNSTEIPLIWDPFSTETQQTSVRFTYRPTSSVTLYESADNQNKSLAQARKTSPKVNTWNRFKQLTAGVEYYDDLNSSSTTTVGYPSSQFPSSTWPSIMKRPYLRPETTSFQSSAQTTQRNSRNDLNKSEIDVTNSAFRPTQRPYLKLTQSSDIPKGEVTRIKNNDNRDVRGRSPDLYERRSDYMPFLAQQPIEQIEEQDFTDPNKSKRRFEAQKLSKTTHSIGTNNGTTTESYSFDKSTSEMPKSQLRPYYSPKNDTSNRLAQQYPRPQPTPYASQDTQRLPQPYDTSPQVFNRRQLRPYYNPNETEAYPRYEPAVTHPLSEPALYQQRPPFRQLQDRGETSPLFQTQPNKGPNRQTRPYYGPYERQSLPEYEFMRTNAPQRPYYPDKDIHTSYPSHYYYSPEQPRGQFTPYQQQDSPQSGYPKDYASAQADNRPLSQVSRPQPRPYYSSNGTDSWPVMQSVPQKYSGHQERPYSPDRSHQTLPLEYGTYPVKSSPKQNLRYGSTASQYPDEAVQRDFAPNRRERPSYRPSSPYGGISPTHSPKADEREVHPSRYDTKKASRPQLRPELSYDQNTGYDPIGSFEPRRTSSAAMDSNVRHGPIGYNNIRRYGEQTPGPTEPEKETTAKAFVPYTKTISQIIESPDLVVDGRVKRFSILKQLMNSSGLLDALNRPTTTAITIFMPTDEAFDSSSDDLIEQINQNPSLVRKLLMQHILSFSLPTQNLRNNIIVSSINGEPHIINIAEGGKILINGVGVIAVTSAQNGIVYVVDKLLQKPEGKSRSITDELRKRSDLSTFSKLIQRTNYGSTLSKGSGPYTVFVPNNDALNQIQSKIRQIANNRKALEDFIQNHVIDGAIYINEMNANKNLSVYDSRGNLLTIRATNDGKHLINNRTQLLNGDITTGNGVVHIVDNIIIADNTTAKEANKADKLLDSSALAKEETNSRQTSIANVAQSLGTKRFINWLTKSGLIDDLLRDGRQYSVIAPTDRAVGKLPLKIQSLLNTEPQKLKNLLEYHILPTFVNIKTLRDNEILPTISGKSIRFNRIENESLITISGAPVANEAKYDNLLIISVDNVLYPPQGSIQTIISKSPILKTLANIIRTAQMEQELDAIEPKTIFAPKDEAFQQIDSKTLERLERDPKSSREFLNKHIMPKAMFTTALPVSADGSDVRTAQALSGDTLKLQRKPNCVSVNGIIISYADITATNGVVHVVDHIL